jgi:4-hydroxy-tetrahydrodipicolinate synthase
MIEFGNVITALITPFDKNDNVNIEESLRLSKHLVANGTDTLLLTGTTGESPTLTHQEEYDLYQAYVQEFKGNVPIMVGTGSNSTRTAIIATQKAQSYGADATLQVVPYYNKPSQEGMIRHFKAIAENTDLPVMLYNIPGRTGVNMEPETIATLADVPNIVAVKEAAGSIDQVKKIKALVPETFNIYSGDDGLTVDFMKEGAVGVVSVASHVAGQQIQKMVAAFKAGDIQTAESLSTALMPLFDVLFITSNPTPVKAALELQGFNVGRPRLPLIEATESERQKVKDVLASLSLLS